MSFMIVLYPYRAASVRGVEMKLFKIFGLMALVLLVSMPDAMAADGAVFSTVIKKGVELFAEIRTIVFILACFGLVGLSVAAIFGKALWKWFGFLASGLMVVGVAGSIVTYFVGDEYTTSGPYASIFNSREWNDTLTEAATGSGITPEACYAAHHC